MILYIAIGVLVLLLIVALSVATFSSSQFIETYFKYDDIIVGSYMTAEKFAKLVIANRFGGRLGYARTDKKFGDCYSISGRTIMISDMTADRASVSSLAVVAHELGHAIQDASGYKLIKKSIKLKKSVRAVGGFTLPLMIAGVLFLFLLPEYFYFGIAACAASVVLFFTALYLKLMMIPLEKDASKRGLELLQQFGAMDEEEIADAKKVLNSAYLTYVGDFFKAILGWTMLTGKTSKE